jgi:hypothetical protein
MTLPATLGPELERVVTVAPFGFQLWDAVAGRRVSDQLLVSAVSPAGLRRMATAGPSGTYSLRHMPSAWAFTSGRGDDEFWANPPADLARWTMAVADSAGRFLPFTFEVEGAVRVGRTAREVCGIGVAASPPEITALAELAGSPPDGSMPVLPLFSSPARHVPAGFATVSAQLADPDGRPVRGAIVRVTVPRSRPAYGLSDDRGMALVPVAYPELEDAHASPPVGTPRPLREQSWPATVEVFADPMLADPARPDLCAVLAQLDGPAARLVGLPQPDTSIRTTLEYGKPLVVSAPGRSELLVDAATSP